MNKRVGRLRVRLLKRNRVKGGDHEMKCVEDCEFMKYSEGNFMCGLYEEDLESDKTLMSNKDNLSSSPKFVIFRCEVCIKDGVIGIDPVRENVRKLKKYIGWMADSFYSHKDEMEENLTSIYRILKSMEEKEEENEDI